MTPVCPKCEHFPFPLYDYYLQLRRADVFGYGMRQVISVENLSKTYHLGQIGTGTFSRDLEVWWAKVRGKPNPMLRIGEKDHNNHDGEEFFRV